MIKNIWYSLSEEARFDILNIARGYLGLVAVWINILVFNASWFK